jgi:hypothetical protein
MVWWEENELKIRYCPTVMLFVLMLFLLGGCCILGKNIENQEIDAKKLASITINHTTASEIGELFGAPNQVIKLSNGNAYIYRHSVAKATVVWLMFVSMGNYDKQYDQIVFFFDNNNILTHYGSSFEVGEASYGLPF